MGSVESTPPVIAVLDTTMRGQPITGWRGDTNRGDARGCTVERTLWMLVSNSEKRLSWLAVCVLFVYLCRDDLKGGNCE